MYFCKKCKSLMVPHKGKLKCSACGKIEEGEIILKEKINMPKDIEVIDEATEHIGDDTIPIVCWNCGYRGVYFWMVQMRRADEPPTRFYKCQKCKKVWRSGK
ncbi:MAG: transcription factor S [archaeon]